MMMRPFSTVFMTHLADDLEQIRHQLNRALDEDLPEQPRQWGFPIELVESKNAYLLRALLPGINPEEIQVQADEKLLTIEGHWAIPELREKETRHANELPYGHFRRAFTLKAPIQSDQIEAKYQWGVLTLTLPKVQAPEKKSIKVQVTS